MADRRVVGCPAGHEISTTLRGRSTTCGQCGRRVYVRADGTTRHSLARSAPGSAPPGRRRRDARTTADWDAHRQVFEPADLVDRAEFDRHAGRTRLFDVDDNLIGWADGNLEDGWPSGE